jgi:hypothetical protein
MKQNMGTADRAIRVVIALVIAALWYFGTIGGTLAVILGVVAVVFLLTSVVGSCPGYLPFGVSTKKTTSGTPPTM